MNVRENARVRVAAMVAAGRPAVVEGAGGR